jgi:hypothetical protein
MIAFGCAITDTEIYERCAHPGIHLAAEPGSEIFAYANAGSIFRTYNLILDRAAQLDDLEAIILLHQDAEIVDPDLCQKAREALRDPDVAIVGCAGAIGVRNIAWWEGSVTWASFTHRYQELGGGEIPALAWKRDEIPVYASTGEVDAIDGFVMALSPWAVRELRFDESLGQALHGYDFDYCLQARAAGRKVVTADFRVIHHHSLRLIGNMASWIDAHMKVAEKWDGLLPDVGTGAGDWRYRARRAEAEASAARTQAAAAELLKDAGIAALEEEIAEYRESTSWRLTAPLRWLADRLRRMRPGSSVSEGDPAAARRSLSGGRASQNGRGPQPASRVTREISR